MSDTPRTSVPGAVAYGVAAAIVVVQVGVTVALSDRYPEYYVDEAFYNWPAVAPLRGQPPVYPVFRRAPHADEVWAYNGPFYPLLQSATVRVLPPAARAYRLPSVLAAGAAVGVLSAFLIRRGYRLGGVTLPILWAADRAALESLYGRPDTLALLFLACGFVALVRAVERRSAAAAWGCGVMLGVACGFHLVAAHFVLVSVVALVVLSRGRDRLRFPIAFGLGGLVPSLAVLACWWPALGPSLEQLRWQVLDWPSKGEYLPATYDLFVTLRWSAGTLAGLLAAAFAIGIASRPTRGLPAVTAAFVLAGLASVFSKRALLPYYLIYLDPWLLLAVILAVSAVRRPAGIRLAVAAVAAVMLPSAAWNGMRLREAVLMYPALDHRQMIARLKAVVPPETTVAATPELLLAAVEAGLPVQPLTVFPDAVTPPPGVHLLVSESELDRPAYLHPSVAPARPVVARGVLFPDAKFFRMPYVLLGPMPAGR